MKMFKIIPSRLLIRMFFIFLGMQVGFTCLFVVIGYFTNDFLSRVPVSRIPLMVPYILPFAQAWGGQFVMVFTTAMVYFTVRQSEEKQALHLSGISMWTLMFPSFLLAFLMSIVSFFMMDVHLSWGMDGAKRVVSSSLESIIYSTLENEGCFSINDDFFLSADRIEDGKMYGIYISVKKGGTPITCTAKSAELHVGPACQITSPDEVCYRGLTNEVFRCTPLDKSLVGKISFKNCEFQCNTKQFTAAVERTIVFSVDELWGKLNKPSRPHTGSMSLDRLNDYVDEQNRIIDSLNLELALESVMLIQSGDWEGFKSEKLKKEYYDKIKDCKKEIRRSKMEPTRRLAFALNCLFLTLVSVPITLLGEADEEEKMLNCIGKRILPVLLVFSAFYSIMLEVVKGQALNPLFLWLPQLTLLIAGCLLIRKAL